MSKIAILFTVLFERFLFLLTYAEIRNFDWLKALISVLVSKKRKKTTRKKLV